MLSPIMLRLSCLLACLLPGYTAVARDITFPSVYNGVHHATGQPFQRPLKGDDGALDLATDNAEIEKFDIAFLGAPFDTAVTGRPGARYGPAGIRRGSSRIHPSFSWDPYTLDNTFEKWAKIVDCGDAPLTWLDNTVALQQLDKAHQIISGRRANSSEFTVPRIITLGGDHTTTLSALRSVYRHFGAVSVVHFDSHIDTWDPAVLGGGISDYAGVNHGTFLHLAHEEGLIRNSSVHAGMRCPLDGGAKHDLDNDARCGFSIIKARDLDLQGVPSIIERLKERVKGTKVYISVDIDVLDPAFAPATGTAEVGGWSTREFLTILDNLTGLEVVGADVVEVAPIYDNPGETTVLAAAEIARSLMSLMVEKPVKPVHSAD